MTFFDPQIECVCDGCQESVYIEPEFVFTDYSGDNGHFDTSDSALERALTGTYEWGVVNGKHYCCDGCVPEK